MTDYYQQHSEEYHRKTFTLDPASFLEPLIRYIEPGSSILDIGCGSGRDIGWLKQHGYQSKGLERASGLIALAREETGCEVFEEDFDTYNFESTKYDALIMIGSLVHVRHEDMERTLRRILGALSQGGHVLLTLKEGMGFKQADDGRLFVLWDSEAAENIFERLNLKVVELKRQVSKLDAEDVWLSYVLRYMPPGAK
ncbi:MAG: class I SAM-dependent methyltransferase [Nitrospira sp.]|nr:class I SAM-dependent methyltransferase [Candidatus Brocadiales bacterium]MBL7050093.1 class I SAM-dependent methyltransferase [Nitrospira sp.]